MMVQELEAVGLRLFAARGFAVVTVEEIAAAAGISVRTFYRYFPTKEDLLQVQIDRRSTALRRAFADRPRDEPPLHSLRVAITEVVGAEDADRTRRWTDVVASTPNLVRAVLGGIQLKTQAAIADFFTDRLALPIDAFESVVLAAAAVGVIQAAQTHWYFNGGDLAAKVSEGLEVLERGVGSDAWARVQPDRQGDDAASSRSEMSPTSRAEPL